VRLTVTDVDRAIVTHPQLHLELLEHGDLPVSGSRPSDRTVSFEDGYGGGGIGLGKFVVSTRSATARAAAMFARRPLLAETDARVAPGEAVVQPPSRCEAEDQKSCTAPISANLLVAVTA
jgi:hypothetical protein